MRRHKGNAPQASGDSVSPRDCLSLRDVYRMNEQRVGSARSPAPPPTSIATTTTTTTPTKRATLVQPDDTTSPLHDFVSFSADTESGDINAIGLARPLSSRDLRDHRAQKARAALPVPQNRTSQQLHKISASCPSPPFPRQSKHGPPSVSWGAQYRVACAQEMEGPRARIHARPGSAGSIGSGRSSYESRTKSPLSISSSIDSYESSRTSVESYSSSNVSSFQKTAPPVYVHGSGFGQLARREPMPMRYAANPRISTTLIPPSRLGPQKVTVVEENPLGVKHTRMPGEGFKKLPEEILLVILGELRKLHLEVGSLSCATCWMRDCCNLGLSCKKWWGTARSMLYENIQLIGCDSILHTKKKFKMKYGTRLKLLRRTLRNRPELAGYVKVLKVPSIPEAATTKKDKDEYLDLIASIIMSCPNLERFPGFYPTYKHEFSRLVHALSTRTKLIEQVWTIDPSPFQRQHRLALSEDSENLYPSLAPGPLLPEQCIDFLDHHSNWDNLQTLFLHCNMGGMIDSALFTDVIVSLPALQHLHVSSFPSAAFNDETLVSLPSLKSLRLDSLPGVTSAGLSTYASLPISKTLTNLSLISLPLLSLPVLARLLSRLNSLKSFTISQAPAPSLPNGVDIFMHPYLASSTLEFLHWELTSPLTDTASDILAKSIQFQGFPSLRTLRAPTDYDGSLQALCKPRERIELPGDRYRNLVTNPPLLPSSQSLPNMPLRSPTSTRSSFFNTGTNSSQISVAPPNPVFAKSPTKSTFSFNMEKEEDAIGKGGGRSLAQARRQAQARIETANKHPQFHIIIWDEKSQFIERHAVGGFVGQIQSKVFYSLKPDIEGMDEAVVRVPTLLDGGEETTLMDGCTGSWNLDCGKSTGKGSGKSVGKERWFHTERGRWREVGLEMFF